MLRLTLPQGRLASVALIAALPPFAAALLVLALAEQGGAAVIALAGCAALYGTWRSLAGDDRAMFLVVIVGYATRIVLIGTLFAVAQASARPPYLFGDEAGFVETATFSARALRQGTDPLHVLAGQDAPGGADPFTDLQALLFVVFGEQAGLMKVVNSVLGVFSALLAFDTVRSLFDRRAARMAGVLIAFFPTLYLWSVTALRDTWIVTLVLLSLWAFEKMRRRPSWIWLAVSLFGLAWIQGLRIGLYLAILPAHLASTVVATRRQIAMPRIAYFATALVFGYGVLMQLSGHGFLGIRLFREGTLQSLELQSAMFASDARTAFRPALTGQPRRVVLPPGEVVRIELAPTPPGPTPPPTSPPATGTPPPPTSVPATATPPSTARTPTPPTSVPATGPPPPTSVPATATPPPTARTPAPTPSRTPIVVLPGQQVVLLEPDEPTPPSDPAIVYVRPGDLVVLQGPRRSVDPQPYFMGFGDQNYVRVVSQEEASGAPARLRRIAASIPLGLVYVVAAPSFGLTATGLELPLLPEMLLWVAALMAAVVALVRERRRWLDLLPVGAYAVATLLLLSIVEGNVGTLIRHRAMLIAPVLLLAASTFVSWSDRVLATTRSGRRSSVP